MGGSGPGYVVSVVERPPVTLAVISGHPVYLPTIQQCLAYRNVHVELHTWKAACARVYAEEAQISKESFAVKYLDEQYLGNFKYTYRVEHRTTQVDPCHTIVVRLSNKRQVFRLEALQMGFAWHHTKPFTVVTSPVYPRTIFLALDEPPSDLLLRVTSVLPEVRRYGTALRLADCTEFPGTSNGDKFTIDEARQLIHDTGEASEVSELTSCHTPMAGDERTLAEDQDPVADIDMDAMPEPASPRPDITEPPLAPIPDDEFRTCVNVLVELGWLIAISVLCLD